MSNLSLLEDTPTPQSLVEGVAHRVRDARRGLGMTQVQLAAKSGVSLGSLRRFEQGGGASLDLLARVFLALGREDELEGLLTRPFYRSIEDVVRDREASRVRR